MTWKAEVGTSGIGFAAYAAFAAASDHVAKQPPIKRFWYAHAPSLGLHASLSAVAMARLGGSLRTRRNRSSSRRFASLDIESDLTDAGQRPNCTGSGADNGSLCLYD